MNCTPKVGHPTFGVFFMAKYEESFKLEVVRQHLSGSVGIRALASRYGLCRSTVRRWVDGYWQHGQEALRKKYSHYSAAFKLSVLKRMWRQELSLSQVAVLFELRGGAGVVANWQRQYHAHGSDGLKPKPRGRPRKMTAPKAPVALPPDGEDTRTLETLRKENEYLRAEVAYLKKLDALVRARRQVAQNKRKP